MPFSVTLGYHGNKASSHEIDLYDTAQALIGFQRSLALTTHLVLNGEIITQSPSLKGATISVAAPRAGSWEIPTFISLTAVGLYQVCTLENNSPLGHLVHSAYDFLLSRSLGINVDYSKTIGELLRDAKKNKIDLPIVTQSQLDSLTEKCEVAIKEIHRPIIMSNSAKYATISLGDKSPSNKPIRLDSNTYDYMNADNEGVERLVLLGSVSSYNANTYKGRIFIPEFGRPISFELTESCRTDDQVRTITQNLHDCASRADTSTIKVYAKKIESKSGVLRKLIVSRVINV